MNKPTITIDGKEIKMRTKARLWGAFAKFDNSRTEIPAEELVDKYCEIIAVAFGVTTDEVLDNLEIDEVIPTYVKVNNAVVDLLNDYAKKNEIETI